MAILEGTGVIVSICVNGEDLQEWLDPDPQQFEDACPYTTRIVSKYIIPQDNQEYSIRFDTTTGCSWILRDRQVITCNPTIDGKNIRGRIARSPQLNNFIQGDTHYNPDGTGNLYKLKFSSIKTVDEATKAKICDDMEQAKGLGQIEVRLWRDHEVRSAPANISAPNKGVQSEFAEKALKGKAISHGTSYSEPQPVRNPGVVLTTHADRHPIAIFVFKYRSKAALRHEMIIPRSPEPSPQREPDGLEGMSLDEIRRLAQRQLKEERVRAKRENTFDSYGDDGYGDDGYGDDDYGDDANRPRQLKKERVQFKRERTLDGDDANRPPARPLKISRGDDGKVTIDLTDD